MTALQPTNTLPALAERINAEHAQCEAGFRAGLDHAIEAGRLLIEAKALCGHGGWLAWLAENCAVSQRTAQAYMRLARNQTALSNTQRVADLPMREALALLSAPTYPDADEDAAAFERYRFFPPLPADEYAAFKASIAELGVLVPVEVDETGAILDGHERVRAWRELRAEGVDVPDYPRMIRTGMDENEKRLYVVRVNTIRAHYTPAQRACIAVDAAEYIQREAALYDPEGAIHNRLEAESRVMLPALRAALDKPNITLAEIQFIAETAEGLRQHWTEHVMRCEREAAKVAREVGAALVEIRDQHLYRETHGTFEDYCRDKWGLDASMVRLVMAATETEVTR
jgi:ParB-like chromosome segregation protein Spo0J